MLCAKIAKNEKAEVKNHHEKKILSQLRNYNSAYLFKYYCSKQEDFPFQRHLLIDACRQPTMNEYIGSNLETISLRTKILMLCQLAQGLSFLK